MERKDHDDGLSKDAGFVDTVRRVYAPKRLTSTRRVAMERDLWERIDTDNRRRWREPAVALVAIAAAVLWFARPLDPVSPVLVASAEPDAWEYGLLFPEDGVGGIATMGAIDSIAALGTPRGRFDEAADDSTLAGYADLGLLFGTDDETGSE